MKQQHQDEVEQLNIKINNMKQQQQEDDEMHRGEIKRIKKDYDDEIKNLKKDRDDEIKRLKKD